MAIKPKKTAKMPTGERPKQLSPLAARTARDVGSASEGAAIAGRTRDFAKKQAKKNAPLGKPTTKKEMAAAQKRLLGKGAMKDGSLSIDQKMARNAAARKKRQATAYSPAPMSAAAKAKAKKAGAAAQAKTGKMSPAQAKQFKQIKELPRGAKAGSSVVSKVVGRAKTVAREVRDIKTAVGTSLRDQEQNVRRAAMGVKPTGKNVGKNLRTQIKEVGSAIKSGKKGTSSDMYSKPGAYNKGTKRK
jgi:hypothetical protein